MRRRANEVEMRVEVNGSFVGKFVTTTRNRPKNAVVDEAAKFLNDLQKQQVMNVVHIQDKLINFQLSV